MKTLYLAVFYILLFYCYWKVATFWSEKNKRKRRRQGIIIISKGTVYPYIPYGGVEWLVYAAVLVFFIIKGCTNLLD